MLTSRNCLTRKVGGDTRVVIKGSTGVCAVYTCIGRKVALRDRVGRLFSDFPRSSRVVMIASVFNKDIGGRFVRQLRGEEF